MFCSNCGAQNADGARFCSGCGCALQEPQQENPQPNAAQMPKAEPQGNTKRIKSPSISKAGMAIGIVAIILAGVTLGGGFLIPVLGILLGLLCVGLSILAIALGTIGMQKLNREYREIAMKNIVYRDEFNSAKSVSMVAIVCGVMGVLIGGFGMLCSIMVMSIFM